MISYKIIVNNTADVRKPLQPQIVKPGDTNYKEVVFQRNLRVCHLKTGERVKIRGTATRGVIKEIITDINQVNWDTKRPSFVHVQFDNGESRLCNPSQLKRSKI